MHKEIQFTKENMQCFISCIHFNKKVGDTDLVISIFENIYYKIPLPILNGKHMTGNIQRMETRLNQFPSPHQIRYQ